MNTTIDTAFTINGVTFANRLLRSSVGGRMAHYDGTVSDVWRNFELRFARGGVAGIISTTLNVNRARQSPLEYPCLADDRFVPPLRHYLRQIRATGVRYVVQLGDPGMATQTSLFADPRDAMSSSSGFDFVYGYVNRRHAMTEQDIRRSIGEFRAAAGRARAAGADGVEITASKGYLIHQFLSPTLNRRDDAWGGDRPRRARFLEEVLQAVRAEVGHDYLVGIRLAAEDCHWLPLNVRLPVTRPLGAYLRGSTRDDALYYALRAKAAGVDFLHIDSGFGFPHPRVLPGRFPTAEIRQFTNATRHLSTKAWWRAAIANLTPDALANLGWRDGEGTNAHHAAFFRTNTGLPVIANGGFQHFAAIEGALTGGSADLVSMARALIANPRLPHLLKRGLDAPAARSCTHCNRCVGMTAVAPLACYERSRFRTQYQLEQQVRRCNRPDDPTRAH